MSFKRVGFRPFSGNNRKWKRKRKRRSFWLDEKSRNFVDNYALICSKVFEKRLFFYWKDNLANRNFNFQKQRMDSLALSKIFILFRHLILAWNKKFGRTNLILLWTILIFFRRRPARSWCEPYYFNTFFIYQLFTWVKRTWSYSRTLDFCWKTY